MEIEEWDLENSIFTQKSRMKYKEKARGGERKKLKRSRN